MTVPNASSSPAVPPDAGTALANELRALHLVLQSTIVDDPQLAEAARQIATLRSGLTGEPRLRWYEADAPGGSHHRDYVEHTLFHGAKNALSAPMRLERDERTDGRVGMRGLVELNRLYEGPPRSAHGGYLAGLFDSLFGATLREIGGGAVTGRLEIKYRKRTPLDAPLVFQSWIESDTGRRLELGATCSSGDVLTAEASALFVRIRSPRLIADAE